MTYIGLVYTFIETPLFTRLVHDYLDEDEYRRLQTAIADDPEAGAIVRGSGGVRKLRWAGSGRGKRGGLRVIYYWATGRGEIWMLTLYPKNVKENIPAHVLRQIRQEIEDA